MQTTSNSDDKELNRQVISNRLNPLIDRRDNANFLKELLLCESEYGADMIKFYMQGIQDPAQRDWVIETTIAQLPEDKIELYQAEAYKVLAQAIERSGLALETNFRVTDKGYFLSHESRLMLEALGKTIETAIPTMSCEQLSKIGLQRPLMTQAGLDEKNTPEVLINLAEGWVLDSVDLRKISLAANIIQQLVCRVLPTADVVDMVWRAKYDDRVLQKLWDSLKKALKQNNNQEEGNL